MKKAGGTGTKIKFVNEIYKQGFAGKNECIKLILFCVGGLSAQGKQSKTVSRMYKTHF